MTRDRLQQCGVIEHSEWELWYRVSGLLMVGSGTDRPQVKEMMVGYDCPEHALYLPATVHTAMGSTTRLNAICVFEHDTGKPITRHTGEARNEMGVRRSAAPAFADTDATIAGDQGVRARRSLHQHRWKL